MNSQFPEFASARVLVLGDVMLDQYWHGSTSRISPEAPVPVVRMQRLEHRPGGAANVAVNIASLEVHADLVGAVGEDDAGRMLARLLREAGVRARLIECSSLSTITKLRVLSRHQQLIRLDDEGSLLGSARAAMEASLALLPDVGALVLSDYAKGTLADPKPLIERARCVGVPILVDPKGADFARYAGSTILTPNLAEFEAVAGASNNLDQMVDRARHLLAQHEIDAMLITRGEQGMSLIESDRAALHIAARTREVYDVTGAGDTVIAVLASVVATGGALSHAALLANLAGSLAVGRLGAARISRAELFDASTRSRARSAGGAVRELGSTARRPQPKASEGRVLDRDELLARLALARSEGERIVMTNGCFDLLHLGHVRYLNKARAMGDRLLVALNDDASVRRLKGMDRPYHTLAARAEVLAGLRAVDWVVSFAEDTPVELIREVSPDVLVKGADYRVDQVAGADHVLACGGHVALIDVVEGYSTTGLLERTRGNGASHLSATGAKASEMTEDSS